MAGLILGRNRVKGPAERTVRSAKFLKVRGSFYCKCLGAIFASNRVVAH